MYHPHPPKFPPYRLSPPVLKTKNRSGYPGVNGPEEGPWYVRITISSHKVHLVTTETAHEGAYAMNYAYRVLDPRLRPPHSIRTEHVPGPERRAQVESQVRRKLERLGYSLTLPESAIVESGI